MNLINATPHAINILKNGDTLTFQPSGIVARVDVEYIASGSLVDDINIYTTKYGDVTGLPPMTDDTMYIVSSMVTQASNRSDLFSPAKLIRDSNGLPIACNGLVYNGNLL